MRQWLFPALMEIGMLGMFFAAAGRDARGDPSASLRFADEKGTGSTLPVPGRTCRGSIFGVGHLVDTAELPPTGPAEEKRDDRESPEEPPKALSIQRDLGSASTGQAEIMFAAISALVTA